MRLHNKTALITGAAAGIGAGVARRFAREGAQLWLCDINGAACSALAQELHERHGVAVQASACDVTEQAQVLQTVEAAQAHFGQIDILVNNAWGRRPGGRGDVDCRQHAEGGEDRDQCGRMIHVILGNVAHAVRGF